jgi:hypothetical protein
MKTKLICFLAIVLAIVALACAAPGVAGAAGTTPLALQTQWDNASPPNALGGCLLYFYQAGTVSTPQQVYNDFGLTQPAPNPMTCSAGGRVPQHWLADGLIHLRLTDSVGAVVLDTTMQTLGPSSGGGGGGGTGVDPTGVASTGDMKFRPSAEVLTGWVIMNGTTIGSPISGATQPTGTTSAQALFIWLWNNCSQAECTVQGGSGAGGGRGANAQADWQANATIFLPDMRSRTVAGRDCMQSGTCANLIQTLNMQAYGGPDSAGAVGGLASISSQTSISQGNLPNVNFFVTGIGVTVNESAHSHSPAPAAASTGFLVQGGVGGASYGGGSLASVAPSTSSVKTGIGVTVNTGFGPGGAYQGFATSGGSGNKATSDIFSTVSPFILGNWYMKL